MATYSRKLKDASGNYIAPATRASCVYMTDNTTLEDRIMNLYPIGSVYQSFEETSPASIFGGEWEKLENTFLYGSGTKSVGNKGGEENHTLSISEMPSHNHGWVNLTGDIHGGDTRVLPENSWVEGCFSRQDRGDDSFQIQRTGGTGGSVVPDIHMDVSHQHNWEGAGASHNNMPPYTVINIWKRVA